MGPVKIVLRLSFVAFAIALLFSCVEEKTKDIHSDLEKAMKDIENLGEEMDQTKEELEKMPQIDYRVNPNADTSFVKRRIKKD